MSYSTAGHLQGNVLQQLAIPPHHDWGEPERAPSCGVKGCSEIAQLRKLYAMQLGTVIDQPHFFYTDLERLVPQLRFNHKGLQQCINIVSICKVDACSFINIYGYVYTSNM